LGAAVHIDEHAHKREQHQDAEAVERAGQRNQGFGVEVIVLRHLPDHPRHAVQREYAHTQGEVLRAASVGIAPEQQDRQCRAENNQHHIGAEAEDRADPD